jgi:hypothetical protein
MAASHRGRTVRIALSICLITAAAPMDAGAADRRLAEAAARADTAAVRQLLSSGADVNAADADGTTPLHWAVWADDESTVQELLRARATGTAPRP